MSAPITSAPGPELLRARAYLSRVAEAGSLAVADLVQREGPVEAARLIRRGLVGDHVAAATSARRERADPDVDLAAAERQGIRLVTPESEQWPHFAFAALGAAQERRLADWTAGRRSPRPGGEPTVPLALWMRGPLDPTRLAIRSVAVVGSRAATRYGENVAAELAYGLARRDVAVVSGGAFGVDACAHRGCLGADGRTVLVSAGGLDRAYPAAHAALFEQVAFTGLCVSESPPGSAPQRHRFLSRNRLIAAFSTGTVIVEAARRSGALNTAAHTALIGRPLMVVPGPVSSAMSVGCHDLIRDEASPATLVTDVDDVLCLIGRAGEGLAGSSRSAARGGSVAGGAARTDGLPNVWPDGHVEAESVWDRLDPVARAVLDAFPARGHVTEDDLAGAGGMPVVEVLRALPILQLAGVIDSGPEGHRLIASALQSGRSVRSGRDGGGG